MLPTVAALAFLPFAVAIGIWVSWSDMRFMKIPNKAVLALGAVWLVVGVLVMPFHAWLWGWAFGLIALVIGFLLNLLVGIGAGDAKFAAVVAPFFVLADLRFALGLIAACMIAALASHRLLARIPAFRAATPDWASWTNPKVPFGLALSGMLIFYLLAEWWF